MSIKENLYEVTSNIENACKKCGRNPHGIMLLAVTKTRSPEEINEIIDLGITNIGENRVQELISKYDLVSPKAKWHLIGHLQRNKVKYIADKVEMIHSVDSFELAKEIDRQCKKIDRVMDILIEINVSGEESKSGIEPSQIYDLLSQIITLSNVRVRGLMTMAPKFASKSDLSKIFSDLFQISVDISDKKYDNISMDYLSMGMSNDYEDAILEGSNIVRIGTALFK